MLNRLIIHVFLNINLNVLNLILIHQIFKKKKKSAKQVSAGNVVFCQFVANFSRFDIEYYTAGHLLKSVQNEK